MKRCSRCKQTKQNDQFYRRTKNRDGLDSWCKECKLEDNKRHNSLTDVFARKREYHREHHLKNREKHLVQSKRNNVRIKYGISLEEYYQRLSLQKSKCKICGATLTPGRGATLDHDHKTGRIRGFLCHFCNKGIGMFRDNVDLLLRAAVYVMKDGGLETNCKDCHRRLNE